jgi:hypothetical protein
MAILGHEFALLLIDSVMIHFECFPRDVTIIVFGEQTSCFSAAFGAASGPDYTPPPQCREVKAAVKASCCMLDTPNIKCTICSATQTIKK